MAKVWSLVGASFLMLVVLVFFTNLNYRVDVGATSIEMEYTLLVLALLK